MNESVNKSGLIPKLRFPEFSDEWKAVPLGGSVSIISDRVGDQDCIPLSITSGVGLVSQVEKYGRTIAGSQYKNYIRLQTGDFAYNKSATKSDPEGFIARYTGNAPAAVPNSIFTCFRVDEKVAEPRLLKYFFEANLHGNFLRQRLSVGARAHGSLNIADSDLLETPIPLPQGEFAPAEQRKVAECLESLDELIAAETERLEALKRHKKGLLQQLFPAEGETTPRLRFPQFRNAGEWREHKVGDICTLISGQHLEPHQYASVGRLPYFSGPADLTNDINRAKKWVNASNNTGKVEDILVTVKGSGAGGVWMLSLEEVALGRQLMAVRATGCNSQFVYQYVLTRIGRLEAMAAGNLIPGLSRPNLLTLALPLPLPDEQNVVSNLLHAVDHEVNQLAHRIDLLSRHRTALMQQLFPAMDEVGA